VSGAIEKVIADWPPAGRGGQLELEIRDATRAEAGSVAFYTAAILADHGFTTTTFTVVTSDVHCALCGELAATAAPRDPQCHRACSPAPGARASWSPAVAPCA
jgi:hypothetical protein